ncbi:MAG TPA: HAD family phosphatase [Flavobacteriales bacterium]|nr:HAD family phosphatase [Flavobacteriales bacterium]HRJ35422.1 HAD family phosphatase [Flavobacteriales bacterium]HRJ38015.1 HAD family phosphatase [Flavobacteriales bacterium]
MIDAIILDLGGVLLNIDYQKPIDAFKALGVEVLYSQKDQGKLFDDLETGKISSADFRNEVRKLSSDALSDQQIDKAWNSILLDLPENRVELLYKLKQKFPLYLLSNTNEIHAQSFEEEIIREYGHNVFEEVFSGIYYSHRIQKRKPNAEAFLHVLKENGLHEATTLFIDDSPQHIVGAKNLGIQAYQLNGELEFLLKEIGVI